MKISELLKQYTDELINEYDDCDLDDLTEEQKEDLMILIYQTTLKIIDKLSDDIANHELINKE